MAEVSEAERCREVDYQLGLLELELQATHLHSCPFGSSAHLPSEARRGHSLFEGVESFQLPVF